MNCRICNKSTKKTKPHKGCKYIYCSKQCAGIGKRKSKGEKQKHKAAYDKQYRKNNEAKIKKRKKEYFKADYDANPEKSAKDIIDLLINLKQSFSITRKNSKQ